MKSSARMIGFRVLLALALVTGGVFVEVLLHDHNGTCTTVGNQTLCSCPEGVREWSQIYWYSAVLILTAQVSFSVPSFFLGEGPGICDQLKLWFGHEWAATKAIAREQVGFWTLMPSVFITWIFAKSIDNAASWGGKFGLIGGVAYAGWYTSFFSASLVGYRLRVRYGFRALPVAVERCYGPIGLVCLNLALLFRLWNEIWSNVAVVASFYSVEAETTEWWLAVVISAIVPALYVIMGGMRASLVSDVVQASLGLFLLFYLLGVVGHQMDEKDLFRVKGPAGLQDHGDGEAQRLIAELENAVNSLGIAFSRRSLEAVFHEIDVDRSRSLCFV